MPVKYVSKYTSTLTRTSSGSMGLLWGDSCEVLTAADASGPPYPAPADSTYVRARGLAGYAKTAHLTDQDPGLLELYLIDVGQGDGILLKTPDGKWHVIDGGVTNEDQMTKKGAANFIRWKFQDDLRRPGVDLETVLFTHPDFDHYGGLCNLLEGSLPAVGRHAPRTFPVSVQRFFHPGMGRFKDAPALGRVDPGQVADLPPGTHGIPAAGSFITELLSDQASFGTPVRPFERSFARLAALVGRVPQSVARLSRADGFLPGYASGPCTIRVLGPCAEDLASGQVGLRWMGGSGGESITRNGHSIVLRVDFTDVRLLLTGDSNTDAQQLLRAYVPDTDLRAHVAKACHHGSDDVDLGFVKAMAANATIISSGDNESYAHPRPRILGASAFYGSESKDVLDGGLCPPLLYSTELARSVKLDFAEKITPPAAPGAEPMPVDPDGFRLRFDGTEGPQQRPIVRSLATAPVSTNLVYGLVNVRTDGRRILLATLREQGNAFDARVIDPRV